MTPSGTFDDDRTLVLTRHFPTPVADVWASVTESDRLGRWFGTWTGDPATGSVMVTMNAEGRPLPAIRYDIVTCEPPHRLAVSAVDDAGHWQLAIDLVEIASGTRLEFRQREVDPAALPSTGPGWEWYLDRLGATIAGTTPPSLSAFETTYMAMAADYAALG